MSAPRSRYRLLGPAVALVTAHVLTALIQAHPPVAAVVLAALPDDLGGTILAAATLVSLTVALIGPWLGAGPQLFAAGTTFCRCFGPVAGPAALLAIGLPQRLVDLTSGYNTIDGNAPLAWLLGLLDVIRGIASLLLMLGLLASRATPAPSPSTDADLGASASAASPSQDPDTVDRREPRLYPALVLLFIMALVLQHGALGNMPHVADEIAQDWDARLLATGALHSPSYPLRASFFLDRLEDNGQWLYSIYQMGLSLLWALVLPFGRIDIVNPVLACLAIFLLVDLLQQTHGAVIARDTGLLLAVSPFMVMMAAGRMNHLLLLVFVVAATRAAVRAAEGALAFGPVMGGLACGLAVMTRQLEGLVTMAAFGVLLLCIQLPWRRRAFFVGVFALACAAVMTVQLTLSLHRTGDPFAGLLRHQALKLFSGADMFTLVGQLLSNITDNVLGFGVYAFGGVVVGWLGFFGLRWRLPPPASTATCAAVTAERFLAMQAIGTVLGYATYTYQDFCYGPRYYFTLLPAAALGMARVLQILRASLGTRLVATWCRIGLAIAILTIAHQSWSVLGNHFFHMSPAFSRFINSQFAPQGPTLLFRRNPARPRLELARLLRSRGVPTERIMALVGIDSLDYDAALAELQTVPVSDPTRIAAILDRYADLAQREKAELFDINELEVIHTNSADPLNQRVVVALDLGDAANDALRAHLPNHRPLIVSRYRDRFSVVPYRPAGVPTF